MTFDLTGAYLFTADLPAQWQRMHISLTAIGYMLGFRDEGSTAFTIAIRDHARKIFVGNIRDHIPAGVMDGGGPMSASAIEKAQAVGTLLASISRIERRGFSDSEAKVLAATAEELADWIEGVMQPCYGVAWTDIPNSQIYDMCETYRPRLADSRESAHSHPALAREVSAQSAEPKQAPDQSPKPESPVWAKAYWYVQASAEFSSHGVGITVKELWRAGVDGLVTRRPARGAPKQWEYEFESVCAHFGRAAELLRKARAAGFQGQQKQQAASKAK